MARAVRVAENKPVPSQVAAGKDQGKAGWGPLYAEDRLTGGGRPGWQTQRDGNASQSSRLGPDPTRGIDQKGFKSRNTASLVALVGEVDRDLDELAHALSFKLANRLDRGNSVADVAEALRLSLRDRALCLKASCGQKSHAVYDPNHGDGQAVATGAAPVALAVSDERAGDAEQRPRGKEAGNQFKNGQKKTSLG